MAPEKIVESLNKADASKLDALITKLNISDLEAVILYAKDKYYNDEPVISDEIFDKLWDSLLARAPQSEVLKNVGAPPPSRSDIEKVKLPYWMGSMDKVKPDSKELAKWLATFKGAYVISEKLDGLSALITYSDYQITQTHLYTRGDGSEGQNIDHLIPYLNLPRKVEGKYAIRGEFVISKEKFSAKYAAKYPKARSLVAGIINSKHPDKAVVRDIDFVAYEIIYPDRMLPSDQFALLAKLRFNLANHGLYAQLTSQKLSGILLEFKNSSKYEIDGIIITNDAEYSRNIAGNPKYSVAFKMLTDASQLVETTVVGVEWNASKHGALKPRIKVEPVILGGDTVMYATGFNAKFIVQNKIASGSKVRIMKSGDVIPYIESVVKQAKVADMPKVPYHWGDTHVDIYLDIIEGNREVDINLLVNFFGQLDVPFLSMGNITKLYNAGFATIRQIYELPEEGYLKLAGVQSRTAKKLYDSIHGVLDKPIQLLSLMSASNVFGQGFGIRKLEPLVKTFPDILAKTPSIGEIKKVDGYSDKTATAFLEGLPKFREFLATNAFLQVAESQQPMIKKTKLAGLTVVLTGFRSQDLEGRIVEAGGKVGSSISSNTSILVAKDVGETSSKIKKAMEYGVHIMSIDEFIREFL